MGYIMTEEHQALVNSIRAFMEKEVKPHVAEIDESGRFPTEIYQKMFQLGLHCMGIPEEFGGGGLDTLTVAMLMEEMSKVDAGIADTMAGVELALNTVLIAGNDVQKKLFADVVIPGNFAAFALTEPDAGSDAAALKTVAVKDGDEYVIDGRKCFITNGGVADIYVVFAMTDKSKGTKGISAFIVERDRAGISVGKEENKMGIRASNTADVVFDGVRVPADHLLGEEGKGFRYAMQSLDKGRIVAAAMALGIAQRALDEAVSYSKIRKTFGKPISELQAIRFMLADMDLKVEAARQLMVHTITLESSGKPFSREAAMAKCLAGDVAMSVASDAVQIHGGYGYSREYPVEKLLRDAKIYQIFEGTNQIQRVVISGHLLK